MKKLPIYTSKTVLLAFEFGLVLSEVAKERGIEVTPEISARAEKIFMSELKTNGLESIACDFVPLVLASFEVSDI